MTNIFKSIARRLVNHVDKRVKRTNWYQNQLARKELYPTNEWYRKNEERNYDIVNIGSSSALFAFNYDYSDLKGLNWAGKPQSVELGFKIFKNFFSILKPSGILCIPLCPFTGLTAPWTGTAEENKFYGILDSTLFTDYKRVCRIMGSPLLYAPKTAIKRIIKDVPKITIIRPKQLNSDEQYEQNAKYWIDLWMEEFNIKDLNAPIPDHLIEGHKKRISLFEEIIKFCKYRDIEVSFVLPPVHTSLLKYFNPRFKQLYIEPIRQIAQLYQSIYIDMFDDQDFQSSDFADSFYLNQDGSKKFMHKLTREITKHMDKNI